MKQLNIQIVDLNHESTQKQKLGRESSDTYWITWKSCENKLYRTNEASYRENLTAKVGSFADWSIFFTKHSHVQHQVVALD